MRRSSTAPSRPTVGLTAVVIGATVGVAPEARAAKTKKATNALTTTEGLPREGWMATTGHFSLLESAVTRSWFQASFGHGIKGGYRFGRWGVFAQVENNMWVATELQSGVVSGAVNIAVGAELFFFAGYARSSLALGPSILVAETLLDDPGRTGIFADGRPIGLHFPIEKHFAITFDPIHVAVVAPVLTGIPLAVLQYRTDLALELRW